MSTSALVKIIDSRTDVCGEAWYLRTSDGYPKGALPSLKRFVGWLKAGLIRDNIDQCSDWLIITGHQEQRATPGLEDMVCGDEPIGGICGWKHGTYETLHRHDQGILDIDYIYTIDLASKTITYRPASK